MRQIDLFIQVWVAASLAAMPAQSPQVELSAEAIVQKSMEMAAQNFDRGKDYTFVQRVEQAQFQKDGGDKKRWSETFDVLILEGTQYQRKIAKNDKPLTGKELEKANREFEKELQERKEESESARRKRLEKERERRRQIEALMFEIPKAYDLRMLGTEEVEGIRAWVIEAKPKPGYSSRVKQSDLLPKMEAKLWIDQLEYQWVKVEAKTIAPMNFGWVMAKIYPGTVLTFRQGRVNSEVWLPVAATIVVDARLAMIMKLRGEVIVDWKQYRKFQSDSRIVSTEEVLEEKK